MAEKVPLKMSKRVLPHKRQFSFGPLLRAFGFLNWVQGLYEGYAWVLQHQALHGFRTGFRRILSGS